MYESFYGLSERPFNLTPDPRYLFLSDKHKEAFAHLLFGIKNRCGFVMVTGEIGTGKTTICRTLLNQLDDDTEVAFIFNPRLSPEDLLRTINEDFGIASKGETAKELIDELNAYLLERNALGKNCVLVIDESQNLAPQVLEQIRLLSNLETETQKLLQIVLIGQPELAQNLALPELRQLNQRITARYHLKPLDRNETAEYVVHRLHTAGGHKKVRFTRGAVKAVYKFSKGTPRVINALCDRALLMGYTLELRDITTRIVKKSGVELRGERIRVKQQRRPADAQPFPWKMVSAAALVALMVGGTLYAPLWLEQTAWAPSSFFERFAPEGQPERRHDVAQAATDNAAIAVPSGVVDAFDGALLDESPNPSPFQVAVGRLEPGLPRRAAAQALLRAWRMAMVGEYPAEDSAEALRAFATQNGFEAESKPLTLAQLRAINLPAFVRMTTDRHPVWVALVGADDDSVTVTTTIGETARIPQEEFSSRYLGEALLVWRDPRPNDPVLVRGAQGANVRALQVALKAAGHYDGPITDRFDAATEEAVTALQAETGVAVDGKVGPYTRMTIAAWLSDRDIPTLTPVSAAATAAVEAEELEGSVEPPAQVEQQVAALPPSPTAGPVVETEESTQGEEPEPDPGAEEPIDAVEGRESDDAPDNGEEAVHEEPIDEPVADTPDKDDAENGAAQEAAVTSDVELSDADELSTGEARTPALDPAALLALFDGPARSVAIPDADTGSGERTAADADGTAPSGATGESAAITPNADGDREDPGIDPLGAMFNLLQAATVDGAADAGDGQADETEAPELSAP